MVEYLEIQLTNHVNQHSVVSHDAQREQSAG